MKNSIKTTALALVAMFAFSTAANAQFGKLLKKAKSAVMGTSSQDAYWEQQKKIDEMRNAQEKKNEEELAEKLKQVGTKPYDANAELPKSPVARTIYTDPKTGQKMMLDMKSSRGDKSIHGTWTVSGLEKEGLLSWQLKDESLKPRVMALFDKKFGGISSAAKGSSTRTDAKYDHMFKVGNIGTETTSWQYRRNDWGTIVCRYVVLMVVMEFDDGENIIGRFVEKQVRKCGNTLDEDGMTVGFVNGLVSNTKDMVINGWEVKTDCFTSTLANK